MKILPTGPNLAYNAQKTNKQKLPVVNVPKDEFIFSGDSPDMEVVYKKINQIPSVREDKVKEVAAKINAGNYHIDSNAIADKIISRIFK